MAQDVVLDTAGPTDGRLHLRVIAVSPDRQGQGLADAALSELCQRADTNGWTVTLAATSDLGSDVRRLVHWYSRHGFVLDRAEPALIPHHVPMIRYATVPQIA